MKLPHLSPPAFVHDAAAVVRRHLLPLTIALTVLVTALGGYIGWNYWQFRQTAAHAFEELKGALHPADLSALANLVDFNALGNQLAVVAAQSYPFARPGPAQITDLSDLIQTALLRQARIKEEPLKETPDLAQRLKTPLYVLPQDFYTQLAASCSLQTAGDTVALVRATVHHPLLDRTFTLLMELERTPVESWKIRRIVNSAQLVREFRAAQLERMAARRKKVEEKNAAVTARFYPGFSHSGLHGRGGYAFGRQDAAAGADRGARNNGATRVNNMNFEAAVLDLDGRELLRRQCNVVQPTPPGEALDHRWTIELDAASPTGQKVRAAGALTCRPIWKTLGLANGEVLHITDLPGPGGRTALIAGARRPIAAERTPARHRGGPP